MCPDACPERSGGTAARPPGEHIRCHADDRRAPAVSAPASSVYCCRRGQPT